MAVDRCFRVPFRGGQMLRRWSPIGRSRDTRRFRYRRHYEAASLTNPGAKHQWKPIPALAGFMNGTRVPIAVNTEISIPLSMICCIPAEQLWACRSRGNALDAGGWER